jgi:hypothetical protein
MEVGPIVSVIDSHLAATVTLISAYDIVTTTICLVANFGEIGRNMAVRTPSQVGPQGYAAAALRDQRK